ncbi:MAG: DUF4399 domain-containing protein [Verrucomicrobiae bacterium]|nr:DUF4399 domain-containing protein [Verrucomicrobiae bacterium]MCP5550427.1 DUF4399 domain-containing protein [Akkermansiaceae bacterium]
MKVSQITLLTLVLGGLSLGLTGCDDGHAQQHQHAAADGAKPLPTGPTKRPDNAKVYIISPKDGDTVPGKFAVVFGLKGMGVAPAGVYMSDEMPTGHHHLRIDPEGEINAKLPFPKDEKNLHFGGGQTETELTLAPGKHTLQLVLGDHNHVPHDPPVVSEVITVTVQ